MNIAVRQVSISYFEKEILEEKLLNKVALLFIYLFIYLFIIYCY